MSRVVFGARVLPVLGNPEPDLVSVMRAEVSGSYSPKPGEVEGLTYPSTSTTTSTDPAWLNTLTFPLVPRPTSARLGTVWPGEEFTFEGVGWLAPVGHT